jgi:hypothetical protein
MGKIEDIAVPFDRYAAEDGFNQRIKQAKSEIEHPSACQIDVLGKHHDKTSPCINVRCTNTGDLYCPSLLAANLALQRRRLISTASMLKNHWDSKSRTNCAEFLKSTDFMTSRRHVPVSSDLVWDADPDSRSLTTDEYDDAANPYGKTFQALMLVEGWRVDKILYVIGISVLMTSLGFIITSLLENTYLGRCVGTIIRQVSVSIIIIFEMSRLGLDFSLFLYLAFTTHIDPSHNLRLNLFFMRDCLLGAIHWLVLPWSWQL